MNILRINSKNKYFSDVIALYQTAFPPDERRNVAEFERIADTEPRFHINVFTDGDGAFLGFLTSWEWDDFRYGEHFAIDPAKRCGGIGGEALRWFLGADSRPLVIEVEPPTDDMARRRIDFYKRNGLRPHADVAYVQPPYDPSRNAIELKLMTYGDITIKDGDSYISRIHRDVYKSELMR